MSKRKRRRQGDNLIKLQFLDERGSLEDRSAGDGDRVNKSGTPKLELGGLNCNAKNVSCLIKLLCLPYNQVLFKFDWSFDFEEINLRRHIRSWASMN